MMRFGESNPIGRLKVVAADLTVVIIVVLEALG
jgi:hypothetical protein